MESLDSPQKALLWCDRARSQGKTIGFVPTMGALHEGHLSLISKAIQDNDICIVSIFVNPLQFNNASDLHHYPDTYADDLQKLKAIGCDMVFTGILAQFFRDANDLTNTPKLNLGKAALDLEGAFRPGHLEGVVTIVDKLFRTSGSCNAYLGEKDFQQTLVIKSLAGLLAADEILIKIIVCDTIREENGLAMSSRNQRLTENEKRLAGKIYQALSLAKQNWQQGIRNAKTLEASMVEILNHSEFVLEYAAIRDEKNWTTETPEIELSWPRALIALNLGQIRLIDNMSLV